MDTKKLIHKKLGYITYSVKLPAYKLSFLVLQASNYNVTDHKER